MRIGVDIRGLLTNKISGVEQYMLNILRELLTIDTENTYVFFYVSYKDYDQRFQKLITDHPYLNAANVEVKTLKWVDFPILLHAAFKPLNWPKADLACGGLDVMFCPSPQLLPLSSSCAKVTTFHDLIFMIHPEFFTRSSRLWQWQMSYGYEARTSDIAIAVSGSTKRDMLRLTPVEAGRARVVLEGVGADYFVDRSSQRSEVRKKFGIEGRYIYFVGSLEPRKNLKTLIAALPKLKGDNSDTINLVISGQKSWLFEDVKDHIAKLNLTNRVIFTGPVTEVEKMTLLQGAEVFVFPSVYEGFGLMVLEAFASKTPVVIADNSSLPEVAGGAALVVPTFSAAAYAEAIDKITGDQNLRDSLVAAGYTRAQKLSWKQAATQTLAHLTEAVRVHGK